jgi:hypothetical protein
MNSFRRNEDLFVDAPKNSSLAKEKISPRIHVQGNVSIRPAKREIRKLEIKEAHLKP